MKKRKLKLFKPNLFIRLLALLQLLVMLFVPAVGNAASILFPDTVTIEWDINQLYTYRGTNADGSPFYDVSTGLFAVYDGVRQPVFCIEPSVVINNPVTPGYKANPLPAMNDKAKYTSVLWKYAGTDMDTQNVAQAIMWEEVNGKHITSITKPDGSFMTNYGTIKEKINTIVTDYQKKPSFHNQTVKVKLGESVTLTDTNNAGLFRFDGAFSNSANVDWKITGNNLAITPTKASNSSGNLTIFKSMDTGTPVAYKKAGQQTVVAGAIDDPNKVQINIEVVKNGDLKIIKRDKESGALVPNTTFTLSFSDKSPNRDVITGVDGTVTVKDVAIHDTEVTIVEKTVPAPYIIDKTPLKAKIIAGETVEVTSNNLRQKGQIKLEKKGAETGTAMWNSNYTLAGNEFQIHKDSVTGPVVKTLKTDANGKAETPADSPNALELGTYWVTESKASPGFVKSFEPVKVDLTYGGQTVPLVVKPADGKNQEVTGQATITKEDAETGAKTQGRATFKDAQYGLYYNEGPQKDQLVKWNEPFKPVLATGTKADQENIVVQIDDTSHQASVKHLALGKFYWQELQAPEGYQIDKNKYEFDIAYKDQETPVITTAATSKENVIKFNLAGFKFVTSRNGSTKSGYNGIKFSLDPMDPTTGSPRSSITAPNEASFDGSWGFSEIPYGDYRMHEVNTPEGFKAITPLLIHNTYDPEKQSYTFTVTEEGQKEPVQTLTIPADIIHRGSHIINFSKLFLNDDSIQVPELLSVLTNETEGKTIYASGKVKLPDQLTYKHLDSFIGREVVANAFLTVNGEKVLIDDQPITATTTFTPKSANGMVTVTYEFDATKLDPATMEKLTSFAELIDEDQQVIVDHADPTSEAQTINVRFPTLRSTATYANREKQAYTNEQAPTVEEIFYTNFKAGEYYLVTQVFDKTDEQVISETETKQNVASDGNAGSWKINQALDTQELGGHELVYLESVYQDPEHTQLIVEHVDHEDADQTISVVEKDTPLIATQAHNGDGKNQIIEARKETPVYDKIAITGLTVGNYYHYDLQLHRIDGDQDTIVYNDSFEFQADQTELHKEVKTIIDTSNDQDGVYYVWTEQLKDTEGNLLADHSNLKDQTETLTVSIPTIDSFAHNGDGKTQTLADKKGVSAYDKLWLKRLVVGAEYHYDLQLHRIEGKEDKIVYQDAFDFKAEQEALEKEIKATLDTSKDANGVKYIWMGQLKNSQGHVLADHSDLTNKTETLTIKKSPLKVKAIVKAILPQAGEGPGSLAIKLLGYALFIGALGYWKRGLIVRYYRKWRLSRY